MSDSASQPAPRERSTLFRLVRRIVVLVVGIPVTIVGLVLLVAPGPGIPLVIAGLAILAIEFEWAQAHMDRVKQTARRVVARAEGRREL